MKTYSNNYYNKDLLEFARELRSEKPTKAERRLWKSKLCSTKCEVRFLRQRPIDHFIVDFFAPDLKLIIEIDGNSHYHKHEYDVFRQRKLESHGYIFIRFSEGQVLNQLDDVCKQIDFVVHCLKGKVK